MTRNDTRRDTIAEWRQTIRISNPPFWKPPTSFAAGLTIHFANALNNPWDFVSNPVGIEIVP